MTTEYTPIHVPVKVSTDVVQFSMKTSTAINVTHIEAGGLPPGGVFGDLLAKRSDDDYDAEWITPASSVEQDNTRPITSGAVYTEIGNINALLATI